VQKVKFCRQLAEIYTKLGQHPFNGLGRLQLSSRGLPEAGPAFFDYDPSGNLNPFDPFSHSNDYYTALIQQKIQFFKTGEIASSAPLNQYLVYMSLLDSSHQMSRVLFSSVIWILETRISQSMMTTISLASSIGSWPLLLQKAFQSPLLLYNLGELYHEGLSTPSEDEKRLSKILREEKGAVELSASAEQKLHFRVDQVIETDPWDRRNFVSLFSGRWKVTNGGETFDWDTWYKQALDKYDDGGL